MFVILLLYVMHDYFSDRLASESVQHSTGKVNAIAGANRQQKQQITLEMEMAESSTSTSDESSDDEEMETQSTEFAVVESAALGDVSHADIDAKTETVTVGSAAVTCQQNLLENTPQDNTEPVIERQKAVNIVVNRTPEIQVLYVYIFCNSFLLVYVKDDIVLVNILYLVVITVYTPFYI